MLNWLFKIFAAILIWVIVALVVAFLGSLLATVDQLQISAVGVFLHTNAGLIGFLAGAAYFVWGVLPHWTSPRV